MRSMTGKKMRGFGLAAAFAGLLTVACAVPSGLLGRETPTPELTATATATATAMLDAASDAAAVEAVEAAAAALMQDAAFIDELGMDMAERRIVDVYEQASPSVVNITTEILSYGFYYEPIPEEGAGSGFVVDEEGHIVTNYHVIEGAQSVEVTFSDETVAAAEVIGIDPRNDLAVLKVDVGPELLVPAALGSSADVRVGQRAIAIGNPFGQFGRTLTTGVISAVDRTLENDDGRTISGVIQTDAAINRGNSGGPLLDSSGRVIGVNSAIFSPSGTSAGLGFAIPIDTVKRVLPDLIALGRYRHPWLGVRYSYSLTPGLAKALQLPVESGVLLVQLYNGSPLDAAGLRGAQGQAVLGNRQIYIGGDVLLAVNGEAVTRQEELDEILESRHRVGDTVDITYLRDGQQGEVRVQLVEEPSEGF